MHTEEKRMKSWPGWLSLLPDQRTYLLRRATTKDSTSALLAPESGKLKVSRGWRGSRVDEPDQRPALVLVMPRHSSPQEHGAYCYTQQPSTYACIAWSSYQAHAYAWSSLSLARSSRRHLPECTSPQRDIPTHRTSKAYGPPTETPVANTPIVVQ